MTTVLTCLDRTVLETELNTNYVSIVRLSTFFLPHLLKLSVREPAPLTCSQSDSIVRRKAALLS